MTPLHYVATVFTCLGVLVAADTGQGEVPLHRDSVIQFATQHESATLLKKRDRFVTAMSSFDRQARLRVSRDVSEKEYLEFSSSQAIEWEPEEVARLTQVIKRLEQRLATFKIPFPKRILLVRTTGKEEGGAAYCRSSGIILPKGKPGPDRAAAEQLLLHELFHILSSHQRELRHRLYALIGFYPCREIQLPGELRDRKITNPDGPRIAYYVELEENDKKLPVVPVLYASVDRFPDGAKNFFQVMQFKLMRVVRTGDEWQAYLNDGAPTFIEVNARQMKPASLFAKIGKNTGYIIHPDEILADNFVHLVLDKKDLPSPQLVHDMRTLLAPDTP